jgi:hypothetical protein
MASHSGQRAVRTQAQLNETWHSLRQRLSSVRGSQSTPAADSAPLVELADELAEWANDMRAHLKRTHDEKLFIHMRLRQITDAAEQVQVCAHKSCSLKSRHLQRQLEDITAQRNYLQYLCNDAQTRPTQVCARAHTHIVWQSHSAGVDNAHLVQENDDLRTYCAQLYAATLKISRAYVHVVDENGA